MTRARYFPIGTVPAPHAPAGSGRRRGDPLVDAGEAYAHWADTGCIESESCLICPLEQCKHDDPAWYKRLRQWRRDTALAADRRGGASIEALAAAHGISVRSVWRALRRVRETG